MRNIVGLFAAPLSASCVAALTLAGFLWFSMFAWGDGGSISLAGKWRFRVDPEDEGIREGWFRTPLPHEITLPGSMAENGFGDEVTAETEWTGTIQNRMWHEEERFAQYREPGNVKIMFWLQPDKYYVGPAWYQRSVQIPEDARGKCIGLVLERCHWETQVWVDEEAMGMQNSLSTPHEYDLSRVLTPGEHTLTIRVDNTVKIEVGPDAHSISDNTQGNWNGIVGNMALVVRGAVWIRDVQVIPDIDRNVALVRVEIANAAGVPAEGTVKLAVESWNSATKHAVKPMEVPFSVEGRSGGSDVEYSLGDEVQRWSEFSPSLYKLNVTVQAHGKAGQFIDAKSADFGMRKFSTDGTQFTLNGNKTFLRGTLECCIFPRTGYPPTDVDSWLRILRIAKAHGLNHLRFHSWCPPEAAFQAADQMGFMYQIECPAWARIGDGAGIDRFVYDESDRILKAYGNHPSFCMLAYGNEPSGDKQKEFLAGLVEYWKKKDPRRLYTSASGWPILPENQYDSTPQPRVHAWGSGLKCRFNASPFETRTDYRDFVSKYTVPVVSHEIGQWCVYPNLDEVAKYTSVLKARNFDIFRDTLNESGMGDQAHDFLIASGKLQALCYKEEIEAALRTPGFGGFQLLDLHDFPGQGTALVGVLDPFWDEKGYITAEEYHRFAGPTVPLLRMDKCVWTSDETFEGDVDIAHFGPHPFDSVHPRWRVADSAGNELASGSLPETSLPWGNEFRLGHITWPLASVAAPKKLVVSVEIPEVPCVNSWDIWVYPPNVDLTPRGDIHVTDALDAAARAVLASGGRVLLLPAPGTVKGDKRGKVPPAFSPIFWNTFWTGDQPPHTLGILCDPAHPALAQFPTEFHSNWQWWDLLHTSQIMILNELPKTLRPVVQVIDDWTSNRRLGLVFEVRVGGGTLLVCGSGLTTGLDKRPVARQMRRSLLDYMASERFAPNVEVPIETIENLFEPPSVVQRLRATASADSQQPGYEASNVLDGNPSTLWHTAWEPTVPGYPHWLVVDLGKSIPIKGLSVLPRQDMTNGRIGQYAVYVSDDKDKWGEAVVHGKFNDAPDRKQLAFDHVKSGRYMKLEALAPADVSHPWASLAELDIVGTVTSNK